jgi:hypothetical protein
METYPTSIKISLIKETMGKELVVAFKKKYGTIDILKRLIEKDPKNFLYQLDLDDWKTYLEHPDAKITNTDIKLILTDNGIKLNDFEIVNVIRTTKPKSVRNLAKIMGADLSNIQIKVKRLAEEGLITLKSGPKNSKIPIVNYNKIEIEV